MKQNLFPFWFAFFQKSTDAFRKIFSACKLYGSIVLDFQPFVERHGPVTVRVVAPPDAGRVGARDRRRKREQAYQGGQGGFREHIGSTATFVPGPENAALPGLSRFFMGLG